MNNDAERAVTLIQSLNTHLTKNEKQWQYILHVVVKHSQQIAKLESKMLCLNSVVVD